MKSPVFPLCLLISTTAFGRDFRPQWWMENIPAGNESVQECYVIKTTPGLRYSVEACGDLTSWGEVEEFYGVGQEQVVTMRECAPAPPPPPGTPPPETPPPAPPAPVIQAGIRMQPASGESGGTVVAWPSLDHGGPVVVRIAGEMDAAWQEIPLFCDTYGSHCFFIFHPSGELSPPATNALLGSKDAALLADLEQGLPLMNQQVIDSVARSRNAPQPAPPDPEAKRFWRVKVDWSVDTDGDGSPDWAEFEIAARGTGSLVPGVSGDAFNNDTNADGIPDGAQLDADLDGTADAGDPDVADDTATVPLGPIPRYALFPITNAQPPAGNLSPLQISDKGTVLYTNGTWSGGEWTLLEKPEPNYYARAINDHDVILGCGPMKVREDPELFASIICYWPAPDAGPAFISETSGASTVYAAPSYDFAYKELHPGPVLSNQGYFSMPTYGWNGDSFEKLRAGFWRIPIDNQPAAEEPGDDRIFWNQGPSLRWGHTFPLDENGDFDRSKPPIGFVLTPAQMPELSFSPRNLVALSDGVFIAMANSGTHHQAQAYVNGAKKESPAFSAAVDIDSKGIAIGKSQGGLIAPIRLGKTWMSRERTLPDLPATWMDGTVKLLDMSPGGWILAQRQTVSEQEYAVMLPVRVEGRYTRMAVDSSGGEIVDTEAVGVDNFSNGSSDPGDAVDEKIWIMTPMNGQKRVVFKSPANPASPVTLSAEGVGFPFFPSVNITSESTHFDISSTGSVTSGQEISLGFRMGNEAQPVTSLSNPIGLKVMKNRVVKVTVYKIARKTTPSSDPVPPDAALMPMQQQLQNHLTDIFKPQINLTFQVTISPTEYPVVWDTDGSGYMEAAPNSHSPDQNAILAATASDTTEPNIKVFIVSSLSRLGSDGDSAGVANRLGRTCWIHGTSLGVNNSPQYVMDTIGHEIGHILVGYGHPGSHAVDSAGSSPLPDTNHERRLMCGGLFSGTTSRLLVKGEWDEAEIWMKAEEQAGRMGP